MQVKSKKALLIALGAVFSGFSILAQPAKAEFCIDVWNPDCDIVPDEVLPYEIAPMTSFDVYLQNNTSRPIWVAASYYVDIPDRTDSTLGGGGASVTHDWETDGYWRVGPFEKVIILNQHDDVVGRHIYFHAHDSDGVTWGSSDVTLNVNGNSQPFFEVDMGSNYSEFTQRFN